MSKAKTEERPVVLLGRPSNNVAIGIVGMPNIGKVSVMATFDALCRLLSDRSASPLLTLTTPPLCSVLFC